jgi:UDP-N-acetyl-D-glucosamine dehydrogenase
MRIAVFGMGKIGLPLAVQYTRKGHEVVGVDVHEGVVAQVNAATEPFPGEAHLAEYLAAAVAEGRLTATTDAGGAVASADAIVVAVPLYVDEEANPDFSAIDAVTGVVGDHVRPGALVSFETTLPVGTTRDRIAPEITRRSGFRVGEDIHLVFSPERVLTGRVFEDLRRYPKLVGGVSDGSEAAGQAFYEAVLDFDERQDLPRPNGVWRMGSSEAAEMAKLAETTYRDVNIALANQFALFAQRSGLDVHAVIEACNSQPFSHIHTPGVAVGGHCIPVYPRLYLWGDPEATVVRAAREANAAMPAEVAALADREAGGLHGKTVLILGAAYRGGVKETAFSGVFPLRDALEGLGARVVVHDPLYSDKELLAIDLTAAHQGEPAEVVIVQADHEEYRSWSDAAVPGVRTVVDGRGLLDASRWPSTTFAMLGRG